MISEEQWENWEQNQQVEIVGSQGNRYRLVNGSAGNVTSFDDEGDIARYCAHPRLHDEQGRYHPNEDVIAAQILVLKTDEQHFLDTANVHYRFRFVDNEDMAA